MCVAVAVAVPVGVAVGAVEVGVAIGVAARPLSSLQPTVSVTATQPASKTFIHVYFAGFTVRHWPIAVLSSRSRTECIQRAPAAADG